MTKAHRATFVTLFTILAVLCYSTAAIASPLSDKQQQAAVAKARIDTLDLQMQAGAARYEAARKQTETADAAVAANSRRLDELFTTMDRLQLHLNLRADYMYQTGPTGLLEVLMSSKTITELSTKMDLLTQLSMGDATTIGSLKVARSQAVSEGESLMQTQSQAAARFRALAASRAALQAQLAQRQALLAGAQSDINAIESAQARRAAAGAAASVARSPGDPYTGPTGSGSWLSAMASWYGPGFYGHYMADGEILRPGSMIVAHKTLPFGTLIEFSFKGHHAVAKVADRGPYVAGREFDLGPGTAQALHFDGVARVQYRIIGR
jgi:rare lipoprotein A (peptidoglycan hydrolase)